MRGISLIETLIYIALFGLIMAGCVVSIHHMGTGSAHHHTHALLIHEASFITHTIRTHLEESTEIPEFLPTSFFVSNLSVHHDETDPTSPHQVTFTLSPAADISKPSVTTLFTHYVTAP